jgi:hypothetical protein
LEVDILSIGFFRVRYGYRPEDRFRPDFDGKLFYPFAPLARAMKIVILNSADN